MVDCLDGVWIRHRAFRASFSTCSSLSQGDDARRNGSFWVGVSFILFGAVVAALSVIQYRGVLKTLRPIENCGRLLGQHGSLYKFSCRSVWDCDGWLLLFWVGLATRETPAASFRLFGQPKLGITDSATRSALEWILDQYKEKKPKEPRPISAKSSITTASPGYKEKVIDLLMRVTTVSVRTGSIVEAMRKAVH